MTIMIFVIVPAGANSHAFKGKYDLAFQHALHLWLQDNEEESLPALADLIQKGNEAALFLLAMVDKFPELQGPWLSLLEREERIALMRAPGVFSGTSWLNRLAGDPLVDAWIDVWTVKSTVETALLFAELGEERAARNALIALESRQGTGFADASDDPRYPSEMRYLIWRETVYGGGKEDAMNKEIAALHPGNPQRIFMDGSVAPDDLEHWLLTETKGTPMHVFCNTECPTTAGQCMRAGMRAMGGYHSLVLLGTPAAGLISEPRFAQSRRGRITVLRSALLKVQISGQYLEQIAKTNECFAEKLAEEAQKF